MARHAERPYCPGGGTPASGDRAACPVCGTVYTIFAGRLRRHRTLLPAAVPAEGESLSLIGGPDYVIDRETGCWVWQKFLLRGYPMDSKRGRVHRVYYKLAKGADSIPAGWDIHHLCRNTACVNPDHLEPRHPSWHRREHQLASKGKLTWDQARELRRRAQTDATIGYPQLAKHYGVSIGHVQDIVEGIAFYEPGVQWIKPDRNCLYCGTAIGQERRRNAKYCDVGCRLAAYQEAA